MVKFLPNQAKLGVTRYSSALITFNWKFESVIFIPNIRLSGSQWLNQTFCQLWQYFDSLLALDGIVKRIYTVKIKLHPNIDSLFSQVSEQELNVYMQQLSCSHSAEFDNLSGLKELYIYINKYYSEIMDTLDESPNARKLGLGHKLKCLAMSVYPQQNICWKLKCFWLVFLITNTLH